MDSLATAQVTVAAPDACRCVALCAVQVLRYLQLFAEHYHLLDLIRFNTRVLQAEPATNTPADIAAATGIQPTDVPWQRWHVTWQEDSKGSTADGSQNTKPDLSAAVASAPSNLNCAESSPDGSGSMHTAVFDAVLVCNGHFTQPNLPSIPGAADFPGLLMHSHNYRQADRFKGQHVAVIGASYSGMDSHLSYGMTGTEDPQHCQCLLACLPA